MWLLHCRLCRLSSTDQDDQTKNEERHGGGKGPDIIQVGLEKRPEDKDKRTGQEQSNEQQLDEEAIRQSAAATENRVEELEEKRKRMEEENKRKKDALAKAIADRCG